MSNVIRIKNKTKHYSCGEPGCCDWWDEKYKVKSSIAKLEFDYGDKISYDEVLEALFEYVEQDRTDEISPWIRYMKYDGEWTTVKATEKDMSESEKISNLICDYDYEEIFKILGYTVLYD